MVYCTNKSTDFVLYAQNCTRGNPLHNDPLHDPYLSNNFALVATGPLPEGGNQMLRAVQMNNRTAPGGSDSRWIADGGCVALVEPNRAIRMGLASWLFDEHDEPIAAVGVTTASDELSVTARFPITAGQLYVLKTTAETTRAHPVEHTISTSPTLALERAHSAWWGRWWNMSRINLPDRPILEAYYYGAHYMLGSFSRPGGVTAGLLGPWSLQDPVGWFDDLTLDYNVSGSCYTCLSATHV
jgi:hypothetical protein